jgi:hypothetical protein
MFVPERSEGRPWEYNCGCGLKPALPRLQVDFPENRPFFAQNRPKPEENRKKPVETRETPLTMAAERLIVKGGRFRAPA